MRREWSEQKSEEGVYGEVAHCAESGMFDCYVQLAALCSDTNMNYLASFVSHYGEEHFAAYGQNALNGAYTLSMICNAIIGAW